MKKVMLSAIDKPKLYYKKAKLAKMKKAKMAKMKKAAMAMKKPKFNAKLKAAAAQGKIKNEGFREAVMKAKLSSKKKEVFERQEFPIKEGKYKGLSEAEYKKEIRRLRKMKAERDAAKKKKVVKKPKLSKGKAGSKALAKAKKPPVRKGKNKIITVRGGTKVLVDERGKFIKPIDKKRGGRLRNRIEKKKPKLVKDEKGKKKFSKGEYMIRG